MMRLRGVCGGKTESGRREDSDRDGRLTGGARGGRTGGGAADAGDEQSVQPLSAYLPVTQGRQTFSLRRGGTAS